jgi:hypothetical protein
MTKPISSLVLAVCIPTFSLVWMPIAQSKQQCSAATPANQHGYWSWRIIDGRKCWYEGKPMLSKSSLEWPAQTSAQPDTSRELASAGAQKLGDPLNSQAWEPTASDTFEGLWRARIEQR